MAPKPFIETRCADIENRVIVAQHIKNIEPPNHIKDKFLIPYQAIIITWLFLVSQVH